MSNDTMDHHSLEVGRLDAKIDAAEDAAFAALSEAVHATEIPGGARAALVEELRRVDNRLRAIVGVGPVEVDGSIIHFTTTPDRSPGGHILRALVDGEEPPKVHGVCCAEVRAVYPGLALIAEADGCRGGCCS